MGIAIVTGAAGGIGAAFVDALLPKVDTIWAVGRNVEKLQNLKAKYEESFPGKILPVKADLTDKEELDALIEKIRSDKPEISYLINNAGMSKMAPFSEFETVEISKTIDLNCKAGAILCQVCIPYMKAGSYILNVASASAFQPNPYIALYAASKVFFLNFTRALNVELQDKGIFCMAVCPGWVDTDMLPKTKDGKTINYPGMVSAETVVACAFKDLKKKKDVSVSSGYNRFLRAYSKIVPHRTCMKQWTKGIKDYI
ncbi:MAG: SDR family NAD(P)-dependent oxidoreductase [Clostridiales bacterium]|nr:SDR family NAD(P)-dependent oxidoreductase [Clostridiales bacterium]